MDMKRDWKVVFPFQAAVSKGTTAAAIASTCCPWRRDLVLFENVPKGRSKIAMAGQQVFEVLYAEMLDGPME